MAKVLIIDDDPLFGKMLTQSVTPRVEALSPQLMLPPMMPILAPRFAIMRSHSTRRSRKLAPV